MYGEAPERFWRVDEIERYLREDHPDWNDEQIGKTGADVAAFLHRDILDWRNSQENFHSHTILYGLDINGLRESDQFDSF